MEETQQKVKRAVDTMMDQIDKTHLREMQRRMFECSSKYSISFSQDHLTQKFSYPNSHVKR